MNSEAVAVNIAVSLRPEVARCRPEHSARIAAIASSIKEESLMSRLIQRRRFSSGIHREGATVPAVERLDGVDMRIGVPDINVASVVAAFGLDRRGARERVIHLLGNFPDVPARRAVAGTTAWPERAPRTFEVLVQVRPVRRTQLGPGWSAFRSDAVHRLRIAEEWMATQHILVALCTAFLDAGHPAPATASTLLTASTPVMTTTPATVRSGQGLLSGKQRDFLADCAGMVVPEDRLTLVGPIRERTVTLRHDDLSFRVRRWTASARGGVGRLDLVDLEAQASASDAPFLFPALRSLARQYQVDTEAEVDPIVIRGLTWASAHQS
jgi:hypothetical protein